MRALSLWRPWPACIIHAGKRVENRGWYTAYRGEFAIHAGKTWDDTALLYADLLGPDTVDTLDVLPTNPSAYPTGIVAVADLVNVCIRSVGSTPGACDCGPWATEGQYHWRLNNIRPLQQPVLCPGRQGWFQVPGDLEETVRAEVAR